MATESTSASNAPVGATPENGSQEQTATSSIVISDVCEVAPNGVLTPVVIGQPVAGEVTEILLAPGQKYYFDFSEGDVQSFIQQGDTLTLTFADNSAVVLKNFGAVTSDGLPATLAFSNELSIDELAGRAIEVVETVPSDDELEEVQSEIRDEVVSQDDSSAEAAAIEPAAGEESSPSANTLANIEPAAGDDGADTGNENSGFTFSDPTITPVGALDAVGPLLETALQYNLPEFTEDIFGAEEEEGEGDPINFIPEADDVVANLDETNLGPLTLTGTVPADFGGDGPGTICADGTHSVSGSLLGGVLSSQGSPITISATPSGYTGTDAGGNVIFTLTLTDKTTGEFEYLQFGPLDHADGTDPNDVITFEFGIIVEDSDGDQGFSTITVNVADDAPAIAAPDANTRDEALLKTGDIVINDTLVIDFGNDGAGTVAPTGATPVINGVTTLTSGGDVITITATTNGYIGTLPGGATAFELVVDPTTGAYTYTQKVPLDHNPTNDTISIEFPVDVTDFDGDSTATTITVNITDSTPTINTKPKVGDGLEVVDETDLPGVSESGQLTVDFGADVPGAVTANNIFSFSGSALGGNLTSGGVPVNVELVGDTYIGYTGADVATGTQIFTLQINPNGSYTFDLLGTLDHADPNDPNDIIDLNFGAVATDGDGDTAETTIVIKVKDDVPTIGDSRGDVDETNLDVGVLTYSDTLITSFGTEVGSISPDGNIIATVGGVPFALTAGLEPVTFTQTPTGYTGSTTSQGTIFTLNVDSTTGQYIYSQIAPFDHPDGTDPNDTIELEFGVQVTSTDGDSDTGTITISVADDGVIANDDVNGAEEGQSITGSVTANDDFSQDVENTVTEVEFGGTTFTIVPGIPAVVTTPLGTLTLSSDGSYTFDAVNTGDPDGTAVFTYTLTDGDTDNDTATLSIRVTPDGQPVAVTEAMTVDETNLNPGPLVINETLNVDFGLDGAGSIDPNGTTSAGGSLAGGILTSAGAPVDIEITANGYVGVLAGSTTKVFELIVQDNGDYSFELFQTLDHADSTDPNDLIQLDFGITIADSDGDTANGTITINVLDDAPVAFDDGNTVLQNTLSVNGNVTDNDIAGEDAPSTVTSITFGTNTVAVVAGTPTSIAGDHGTLTINADGTYTYVSNGGNANVEVDEFTYGYTDFDGDTDTAELTITIQDVNDQPKISSGFEVVDETDLPGVSESGQLVVDFGGDGPGTVTPNDVFTSSGSQLGGTLSSNGTPVTVTLVGDTYVGHTGADPNLNQVFTLEVNTDGSYTFDLLGTLDHADPNDPNDIIQLDFGVVATDADQDTTPSTITVLVKDDVPTIGDSVGDVDETNFETGDLTYSDTLFTNLGTEASSFTPANNVRAEVGGNPFTLTSEGEPVTLVQTATGYEGTTPSNGTVFTLVMDNTTGQYVYTQTATFDHPDGTDPNDTIELLFDFVVQNSDGDSETGTVIISVADDGPVANDDVNGAAEGQDITGSVTANDDFSEDNPNDVTQVEFNGTTYPITAGTPAVIDTPLGQLTLNQDGSYAFDAVDTGDPDGTVTFTYTLVDRDGDSDTAELSIKVTPDGEPIIVSGDNLVDETALTPGPLVVTDSLDVDFGLDGAGSVDPNGTTSFGGSATAGNLTSNDVPVDIRATANGYEGVLTGTNTQVFELIVQDNGDYSFELFGPLDHADGSDPNDAIQLNFGVTATDFGGDQSSATITISVLDDAPIANDDTTMYDTNAGVANGNVIANDDLSEDNAAPESADHDVVEVSFTDPTTGTTTTVVIPEGGSNSISGQFGTLTIQDDGTYSYVLNPGAVLPTTGGTSELNPTQADVDGIQESFSQDGITVSVANAGDFDLTWLNTSDGSGLGIDNLNSGDSQKVWPRGETFDIDFATEATTVELTIAEIGSNNNYGKHGVDFTITFSDGSTAVGEQQFVPGQISNGVFSFTIDSSDFGGKTITSIALNSTNDGQYDGASFLLNNVKATHPGDDCIVDEFEYVLQDGDGDQSTATLSLKGKDLVDDKPVIDTEDLIVDETDLNPTDDDSGVITADFGSDGPGTFTVTGANTFSFDGAKDGQLTSDGEPVSVSVVGNTYVGSTAGGETIFTLTLNQTTGEYEFVLEGTLDHADATNPDDIINLKFGVTANDSDDDSTDGVINVAVKDDGPVAHDDCNDFTITAENKDFNVVLVLDVSGSMRGDKLDLLKASVSNLLGDFNDYQGGEIKVHLVPFASNADVGSTFTVTDAAGFQAALDALDAFDAGGTTNYEAALQQAVSWLQGDSNNDPIAGADTFSYFVSDGQPNRFLNASGDVERGDADEVVDEITGSDGTNEVATLQALSTEVIGVGIDVNQDTLDIIDVIDSDGNSIDVQDPTDLDATFAANNPLLGSTNGNVITGENGGAGAADDLSEDVQNTVTQVEFNGNVVDVDPVNGASIQGDYGVLTIQADGSYSYKLTAADINGNIVEAFKYTLTDADGDSSVAYLKLKGKDNVDDDPVINTVKDLVVDETDLNPTDSDSNIVTADFGADGPGTFLVSGMNTFSFDGAKDDQLTSNGTPVDVQVLGNSYVGSANGDVIFTLTLDANTGEYEFVLTGTLDHADATNHDDVIALNFGVTAKDSDNDVDTGSITVHVKDDGPFIDGKAKPINEADFKNGDSISISHKLNHSYGKDGEGEIRATDDFKVKYKVGGADQNLTSGGEKVFVEATNTGYIGKLASGAVVLELLVNNDGTYKYTQYEAIDHPSDAQYGEVIWLKFGVEIVDADMDTDQAYITIDVRDGKPDANNDYDCYEICDTDGHLVGDVLANDHLSADDPNLVTQVKFDGHVVDVPTHGTAKIDGDYGSLEIAADGSYTYNLYDVPGNESDQVVYTYNVDHPGHNDAAGEIKNVNTSYNETTKEFAFQMTIDQKSDGFFVAINGGPNPKGHEAEMALIYFDASNPGDPKVSIYAYNGVNGSASWKDGSKESGTQDPDPILNSIADGSVFSEISVTYDAHGNEVYSLVMDATAIQDHVPALGPASDWTGVSFGDEIGMWLHPVTNLQTSYGSDGYLTEWAGKDGWYDIAHKDTHKEIIDGKECEACYDQVDVFHYVVTDADGDSDTAKLTIEGKADTDHSYDYTNDVHVDVNVDVNVEVTTTTSVLYQSSNENNFLFEAKTDEFQTVQDFDQKDGDVINITEMIAQPDDVQVAVNEFVFTTDTGDADANVNVEGALTTVAFTEAVGSVVIVEDHQTNTEVL